MWLLKDCNEKPMYLKFNEAFTVGRRKGRLVLSDDSVSRHHAEITITPENRNEIKIGTESLSTCVVKDTASKYGTYIIRGNDPELRVTKQGNQLQHMDKIRFGAQDSEFTVVYVPLITAISGLDISEQNELRSIMDVIDGKISPRWDSVCTYMTISKSNISEKLTCSLAFGTQIVPIEYWNFVLKAFEANEELPNPMEFEKLVKGKLSLFHNISFAPNPQRKTIFKDLLFIHYDSGQYNLHKRMIELAGGKSMLYRHQKEMKVDVCDDNVIVIQLVESNTTQATGTGDGNYSATCEKLGKCQRRAVPSCEIALAIFHCSTEKFCNPKHDHAGMFKRKIVNPAKESMILAPDTLDVDFPSISNRQGESSRKAWIKETVEASNVESQSFDVSDKSYNNLTVSTANTSCLSQIINPFANKRSKVIDSQSQLANADEKKPTQDSQRHINYESHVVLEINENSMKRGRDDDDDNFGITKKKVRNELSQDKYREQKETEKAKIINVDSSGDDDDFVSGDDKPSTQKNLFEVNEKSWASSNYSSVANNEKNKQRSQNSKAVDESDGEEPVDGEIIPESISTSSSISIGVRESHRVDEVETFRKPKSVKDSPLWTSLKNPLKRGKTSNSSPKKKLKISDQPETGQTTLTKFLSPKKNTNDKMKTTEVQRTWNGQRNSTVSSTPYIDSKKDKIKLDLDATSDVKPFQQDISFERLLRMESSDDVTSSSAPRFRKTFRKAYQVKPRRIELDDMIDMHLWSEQKPKSNEKDSNPRKVSPSKKIKNMFRV